MISRALRPFAGLLLLLAGCVLLATPSEAAIRYVNRNATGANTGLSWVDAYRELVSAINAAQPGDEIWIARGIYYPDYDPGTGTHTGDRSLRFHLKSGVKFFGGFAGNEINRHARNWQANRTVLSGDIGQRGFDDNTQTLSYVLAGSTDLIVEGLVFAAGNASIPDIGNGYIGGAGGAVWFQGGSAEFRHCAFVGNFATYGGAIFGYGGLTLTNCVFAGNSAVHAGGAVLQQAYQGEITIRNCTIVGNTAPRGAAVATNSLVQCQYFNNIIHSNTSTNPLWQVVETGNGEPLTEKNILQVALHPPGQPNLVVASPRFFREPSPGADALWGTMDDVLDGWLLPDSPAVGFASANRLAADITDLDGDGDVAEPIPFDILRQPRVALGTPDAGACEFINVTLAPTLMEPAPNTAHKNPVRITYELPENALTNSVKLSFERPGLARVYTISSALTTEGTHSFHFNPAQLPNNAMLGAGPLPDGVYAVRLSYQDTAGAPAASMVAANVRIDTANPTGGTLAIFPLGPTLIGGQPATARFANWTDGENPSPLIYQLLIDDVPVAPAGPASEFSFTPPTAAGLHTFVGVVRDLAGNTTSLSLTRAVVSAPKVTVHDPLDARIDRATVRATVDTNGLDTTVTFIVDGFPRGSVILPAGEANAELYVSPLLRLPSHVVVAVATNAAGTTISKPNSFASSTDTAVGDVTAAIGAYVRSTAPETRIPGDAVWRSFEHPAVNAAGQIALLGRWTASPSEFTNQPNGTGIFVDKNLIIRTGEDVNGVPNAKWIGFRAPVLSDHGDVAFIGTIAGPGINTTNDTVVAATFGGGMPKVLARERGLTSSEFARFGAFTSVAIQAGETPHVMPEVFFEATLAEGTGRPAVTAATDRSAWSANVHGNLEKLFREGDRHLPFLAPGERLRSFSWLASVPGSPGQGRGVLGQDTILARWTLTSGHHLIVAGWPWKLIARSESPVSFRSAQVGAFLEFGPPAADRELSTIAARAAQHLPLRKLTRGVASTLNGGQTWTYPVSNFTPSEVGDQHKIVSVGDPVVAIDNTGQAVLAREVSSAPRYDGDVLYWLRPNGERFAVAREHAPAPIPGVEVNFDQITSIAIPGGNRGPIFTATIKRPRPFAPGTKALALCWTDGNGGIEAIAHEGGQLGGKIIQRIRVLAAVPGASGTTRAFNTAGELVYHATFIDGTSAIVRTNLP